MEGHGHGPVHPLAAQGHTLVQSGLAGAACGGRFQTSPPSIFEILATICRNECGLRQNDAL